MNRWRHVVVYVDCIIFWRGCTTQLFREYPLTPERLRRLEVLLGDAIEPAQAGQSWLWSWNDWDWNGIGGK